MNYLKMLPYQVREAIENNYPIILPIGVVEYHAEHLPLGTDAFTAIDAVERLEKRHPELIILPPFYYGSASFAVASPEGDGTVQVDSAQLIPVSAIYMVSLPIRLRALHRACPPILPSDSPQSMRSLSFWKKKLAKAGGALSSTATTIPVEMILLHGSKCIPSACATNWPPSIPATTQANWKPVRSWPFIRNV